MNYDAMSPIHRFVLLTRSSLESIISVSFTLERIACVSTYTAGHATVGSCPLALLNVGPGHMSITAVFARYTVLEPGAGNPGQSIHS